MVNEVYIVVGVSGSYSDRSEWEVAAYPDSLMAMEHARRAQQWAEKKQSEMRAALDIDDPEQSMNEAYQIRKESNPFDPVCLYVGDEIEYVVSSVPYLTVIPEEDNPMPPDPTQGARP